MPKIVISYRRADTEEITGRIFDRLCLRFGKRSIFRDIDNIPAGTDFREHVDQALQKADVMLAIVGPGWLNVQASGQSTLHADYVRVEIEAALRRKLRVIPVLVRNAKMPDPELLPHAIRAFAYLNAVEFGAGRDFDGHMRRLIRAIDNRPRWIMPAAAASIILLMGGGAIWQFMPRGEPVHSAPLPSKGPLISAPAASQQPAMTAVPRTESGIAQAPTSPPPSPAPSPAAVVAPPPASPQTSPIPRAAVSPAVEASRPAKNIASLPKPPQVQPQESAPPVTMRIVTAIEGEAFVLCGQPDFVVTLWQPRPNAPTEVSLRRSGMMMADGLSLKLAPGKPRSVVDGCDVSFVEVKSGFRPIAVLEERRRRN